ncbi:transcriptional regulator [Candidatus Cytomitobacter indipagum]|uniref:Transcriptional regulator n=2 Tax=Candidatus Cytomitobacter indipagum TaxID=2601575 RepID=A0A5C0UF15_9PROT|nr:transcriptional regulator [Candidatus Cytomitobacter indipagum]
MDATVSIFTAIVNKLEEKIEIEDIRQMLYSIKSQVTDVFRSPDKPLKPAVPIEDSVRDDCIICLEDGKELKVLKRYLQNRYHMSPEVYKKRWGLPEDYPMVAPNYSDVRKRLAIKTGLGYSKTKDKKASK